MIPAPRNVLARLGRARQRLDHRRTALTAQLAAVDHELADLRRRIRVLCELAGDPDQYAKGAPAPRGTPTVTAVGRCGLRPQGWCGPSSRTATCTIATGLSDWLQQGSPCEGAIGSPPFSPTFASVPRGQAGRQAGVLPRGPERAQAAERDQHGTGAGARIVHRTARQQRPRPPRTGGSARPAGTPRPARAGAEVGAADTQRA